MKKAHITLVGGQPTPVYVGIICHSMVDEIVLICSEQTKGDAERIEKIYRENITNHATTKELAKKINIEEWSPVELEKIYASAENLKNRYKDYEVTLNLTGGTKPWALALFEAFGKLENAQSYYVDQNNVITNIVTKKAFEPNVVLDPATRFQLHGTPLSSQKPYTEYKDSDFKVMERIERLRNEVSKEFNELVKKAKNTNKVVLENGSTLEYNHDAKRVRIYLKYTRQGKVKEKEEILESPHVYDLVFKSGWFELKVARELVQNAKVPKESIMLNCIFSNDNGKAKNEIDIIANLGNRLLFVECKTMIYDPTDIDKFNSALKNFSGIGSVGLFVTNDKPPQEENKAHYSLAKEKCNEHAIKEFNFYTYNNQEKKNTVLRQKSLCEIVEELRKINNKK